MIKRNRRLAELSFAERFGAPEVHKPEDEPYVDNYPPLKAWLADHGARCMWQVPVGGTAEAPASRVEMFVVPQGSAFIVQVHADKKGWDVFTYAKLRVDTTFADLEARLGLAEKPTHAQLKEAAATALERAGMVAWARRVRMMSMVDLSIELDEVRDAVRCGRRKASEARRPLYAEALRAVAVLWASL